MVKTKKQEKKLIRSSVIKVKNPNQIKDFDKNKRKLGTKSGLKKKPTTLTDLTLHTKSIAMPSQSINEEKGEMVTHRKLELKDLLSQLEHHNQNVRRDALLGMRELFQAYPSELLSHLAPIFDALVLRMIDSSPSVRKAFKTLLSYVLGTITEEYIGPFMPLLVVHISNAMTSSLSVGIEIVAVIDAFIVYFPQQIAKFHSQLLSQFVHLIWEMDSLDSQLNCHILEKKLEMISCLNAFLRVILQFRLADESASKTNNNNSHDNVLQKNWDTHSEISVGIQPFSVFRLSEVIGVEFQGNEFGQSTVSNSSNIFQANPIKSNVFGLDLRTSSGLNTFFSTVFPKLIGEWIECKPDSNETEVVYKVKGFSDFSTGKNDISLRNVKFGIMLQILQIVNLLFDASSEDIRVQMIQLSMKDIFKYVFESFPLQKFSLTKSRGGSADPSTEETKQDLCVEINVNICKVVANFFALSESNNASNNGAQPTNPRKRNRTDSVDGKDLRDLIHGSHKIDFVQCISKITKFVSSLLSSNHQQQVPTEGENSNNSNDSEIANKSNSSAIESKQASKQRIRRGPLSVSHFVKSTQFHLSATEVSQSEILPILFNLLSYVNGQERNALLEKFNQLFESCHPKSKIRISCLKFIQLVLQKNKEDSLLRKSLLPASVKSTNKKKSKIVLAEPVGFLPEELKNSWAHSLPKLLWRETQPDVSQLIIYLMKSFAFQCSAADQALFDSLQVELIPFFYTKIVKDDGSVKHSFGPFAFLPLDVQKSAIELLYYFSSLSSKILQSMVACTTIASVSPTIVSYLLSVLKFPSNIATIDLYYSVLFSILIVVSESTAPKNLEKSSNQRSIAVSGESHLSRIMEIIELVANTVSILNPNGDFPLVMKPQIRAVFQDESQTATVFKKVMLVYFLKLYLSQTLQQQADDSEFARVVESYEAELSLSTRIVAIFKARDFGERGDHQAVFNKIKKSIDSEEMLVEL